MEKRHYETTFLFAPDSPEEMEDITNEYRTFLQTEEAEAIYEQAPVETQLAYPIQKRTSGTYHSIEFKALPPCIKKLETKYGRDDRILRFLIIRLNKHALQFKQAKRATTSDPATPETP